MTQSNVKASHIKLHFNPCVPWKIRDKLYELAEEVKQYISNNFSNSWGCGRVDKIYGQASDGYIPFQNGGYEVTDYFCSDTDPSYHFCSAQTDYINKIYDGLVKTWCESNNLTNFNWAELTEEQQEDFQKSEVFEPAMLRFECWTANKNKISLRLSLAYSDAPYYRASRDDVTFFNKEVTAKTFLGKENEKWVKQIFKGI